MAVFVIVCWPKKRIGLHQMAARSEWPKSRARYVAELPGRPGPGSVRSASARLLKLAGAVEPSDSPPIRWRVFGQSLLPEGRRTRLPAKSAHRAAGAACQA